MTSSYTVLFSQKDHTRTTHPPSAWQGISLQIYPYATEDEIIATVIRRASAVIQGTGRTYVRSVWKGVTVWRFWTSDKEMEMGRAPCGMWWVREFEDWEGDTVVGSCGSDREETLYRSDDGDGGGGGGVGVGSGVWSGGVPGCIARAYG